MPFYKGPSNQSSREGHKGTIMNFVRVVKEYENGHDEAPRVVHETPSMITPTSFSRPFVSAAAAPAPISSVITTKRRESEGMSDRIPPPTTPLHTIRRVSSETVNIYTDGSCLFNGKKMAKGGIGVFFGDDDPRNISECVNLGVEIDGKVTNQAAELLACVKAVKAIETAKNETTTPPPSYFPGVVIHTDSEYVVKSMNVWAYGWNSNGWKNKKGKSVANVYNMRRLFDMKRRYGIRFKHVPAHTHEPFDKNGEEWKHWYGNARADDLAKKGTAECTRRNDTTQLHHVQRKEPWIKRNVVSTLGIK